MNPAWEAARQRPTVFIVDDDSGVRQMIARMVRSVGLAAEAFASVEAFRESYDGSRPGCLVLDIRMPGESGLALQEQLVENGATIPIIFISGHGSIRASVQAMKQGAVDFLEKPFDEQSLLDAINRALLADTERRHSSALHERARARLARLTPRERQVLAQVVAGLANKQIALQLGTTEQTIKMHRGRVMAKMEAESVPELVLLAQLAGVIAEPS